MISTHNPNLLSQIYWNTNETKFFYVYFEEGKGTRVCELNYEEFGGTSFDLIEEPDPKKVVKYCKR